MVFVHARNATVRTAMSLIERAKNNGQISYFLPTQGPEYGHAEKQVGNKWQHKTRTKAHNVPDIPDILYMKDPWFPVSNKLILQIYHVIILTFFLTFKGSECMLCPIITFFYMIIIVVFSPIVKA